MEHIGVGAEQLQAEQCRMALSGRQKTSVSTTVNVSLDIVVMCTFE